MDIDYFRYYTLKPDTQNILLQNYPNPFKENTTIKYRLVTEAKIEISIFDLSGKKITTLVNQMKQSGTHEVTWSPENMSSGIYYVSLSTGSKTLQTIRVSYAK